MASDAWLDFNGIELVNAARTAQLAEAMGIDTVWVEPSSVAWVQDALGGADYDVVGTAPWYDPAIPASAEFAGFLPLSISGLDDSTFTAEVVEYVSDGGRAGRGRRPVANLVFNGALVASTDRGADFGKRWLDRVLTSDSTTGACRGAQAKFFRYEGDTPPFANRNEVALSRGTSVTRKRKTSCAVTWLVTWTMTSDPFVYSDRVPLVYNLGGMAKVPLPAVPTTPIGATVLSSGVVEAVLEEPCPQPDFAPVYHPSYPALVAPPSAPVFFPGGWVDHRGDWFRRQWVRVKNPLGAQVETVPVVTLEPDILNYAGASMVRVGFWPGDAVMGSTSCDPLWSATVMYLPTSGSLVIDVPRRATYLDDPNSLTQRRADTLVYGPGADPVSWLPFSGQSEFFVSVDMFALPDGTYPWEGNGDFVVHVDVVERSA